MYHHTSTSSTSDPSCMWLLPPLMALTQTRPHCGCPSSHQGTGETVSLVHGPQALTCPSLCLPPEHCLPSLADVTLLLLLGFQCLRQSFQLLLFGSDSRAPRAFIANTCANEPLGTHQLDSHSAVCLNSYEWVPKSPTALLRTSTWPFSSWASLQMQKPGLTRMKTVHR